MGAALAETLGAIFANLTLPPSLSDVKGAQVVTYYELVRIETQTKADPPVDQFYNVTNAPYNVDYSGVEFVSAGALLALDSIENNINFEVPKINITVSGIIDLSSGDLEPKFIQTVLDLNYVDRPLKIFRSYFHEGVQIGTIEVFRGLIDSATIQYSASGQTSVSIQSSSHWVTFEKKNGRRTNTPSQQQHFASDIGLDGAAEVQKEIVWK